MLASYIMQSYAIQHNNIWFKVEKLKCVFV